MSGMSRRERVTWTEAVAVWIGVGAAALTITAIILVVIRAANACGGM